MIALTHNNKKYQYTINTDINQIKAQVFTIDKSLSEDLTFIYTLSIKEYNGYLPFSNSLPVELKEKATRYVDKFLKLKVIW